MTDPRIPNIRKIVTLREETLQESGRDINSRKDKVTVAAVIKNPYARQYVESLEPLYDLGKNLSGPLTEKAVIALGVTPDEITAYGKGAIVGTDGEIEHAAAIMHPRFGAPVRKAVGKGDDIIPSTKKVGAPGASIVMPITNKDSIWVFDDMDAMEISVPDAPKADEILVAVLCTVTTGFQ